jgi:ComF family protein
MFSNGWVRGLLELVAPRPCVGCDVPLAPAEHELCGACAPLVDLGERTGSAMAGYLYGGPMADAIRRLKYGRRTDLAPTLGAMLARRAIELAGEVEVVIPVPLHPARLRARGFNQAALIARPVANTLGVPLATSVLRRTRDTAPQAGLDAAGRVTNVRGAFASRDVSWKSALVIDDVHTTGSTLAECATVLARAGANRVITLVLAKAEV